MRSLAIVVVVALAMAGFVPATFAAGKIRLAQSSTVTTCMMGCNAQAANCQTSCLIPGAPSASPASSAASAASGGPNATASTTCLLACGSTRLTCQTSCARQSPSP